MNNTNMQKSFFVIMLLIMAASVAVPLFRLSLSDIPKAVKGTLDLRDYDGVRNKTVKLSGEWEFYFGQLLTPEDFKNQEPSGKTIQNVPASWGSYQIEGEHLPPQGSATYRLRILLPAEGGNFGIKITCISASARIFADDQLILECGSPGNSPETTVHKYYADTGYFQTDDGEVEILVQAADFSYVNSGILYEIHFGDQKSIAALRMYDSFLDISLISGMSFLALYFFGLGLQRKKSAEILFFALYCLVSSLQASVRSEALLNYALPALSYNTSLKILIISYTLCLYALIKFLYHAQEGGSSRRANLIIDGITLFFILLDWFTDFYLWGYIYTVALVGQIYVLFLLISLLAKNTKGGSEGRYYLFSAVVSSLIHLLTILANFILLWESNLFLPVFQPIFVLSLALYMSEKYENSFKTIEKLSDRLVVLDKLKDDFLAKTSHELKTPLNGIINISQSLLDGAGGSLSRAQAEDIRLITSIGKRLSTLVYDILDYSKLKVMDIQLHIVCLDVHQVAESTVDIFRYLIKGRPITLENKIPPNQYLIMADENRLKQIFSNLLDNSLKYTELGSISLSCRQDGGFLWIQVSDTGIGIPADKLKDIFAPYEQLGEQSANQRGIGLGLTITQQLIELHGGQIVARSEPGQGTSFTFSIPLAKDNKPQRSLPGDYVGYDGSESLATEALPQTVHVGGEFSILVVDDEFSNLKALMNILTLNQYNVTVAINGEAALHLLKGAFHYDLCILDVMMPGISGYEVCRKIRETYSPLELPILLLTAKALPEDMEAGFRAGANDFIEKPFEVRELKCRVSTLVQLKNSMDLLLKKETAFLQAQIRPHFLFNALNTIYSFCYTNPGKAGELLAELGVFLRSSFDFSSTASLVTVEKELRLVKAYVAIEEARFGSQLEVEYAVEPSVLNFSILPLMIQPIVENSIRHGLLKRSQGGKVSLSLTHSEDCIQVEVIDNGVGIPASVLKDLIHAKSETRGVGLTNISRRLLRFYGTTLTIFSVEDHGTTVSFRIPAKT
ncbi:regulator [Desulfitobacterium hafniense]|uniref:Stage 0 sporulation protein A homolog n=1 Tax=Desulfitobacterium hafniense TaxID=49338 RepID=A0A0W1JMB3_DESHA|nr:ATP-binding protein [Desulfitobacterium hafniense]KTE92887.1 regulator [Desulfitobacterium hafniense]